MQPIDSTFCSFGELRVSLRFDQCRVSFEDCPMRYGSLLIGLLIVVFYPLWLVAGFLDYVCHRRTGIERTSGTRECLYHLAQFVVLAIGMVLATTFALTGLVLAMLILTVGVHSALSYLDVRYTQPRRRISALEQHVHGYMDVLPVAALGLWSVLNWDEIWADPWDLRLDDALAAPKLVLLASFAVCTGLPVLEELWRASSIDQTGRVVSE
jgi:hypothetical protein